MRPFQTITKYLFAVTLLLFILYLLLTAVIGCLFYKVDILEVLSFLYVLLVWVWGPGAFILSLMCKKKALYGFGTLSFAVGVFFLAIAYAACIFFMFPLTQTFLGPVLTLLFILQKMSKSKKNLMLEAVLYFKSAFIFWVFGIILISLVIIMFFLENPAPELINGATSYNPDVLWSVGNMEAFARQFPPIDSRISGLPFYYHYFSMLYRMALASLAFIDSFKVTTLLYPASNIIFIMFALRFFYSSFSQSTEWLPSLFYVVITLMTACLSSVFNFFKSGGLFLNIFDLWIYRPFHGFELCLPFFLISLGLICRIILWHSVLRKWLYIIIFIMSCAATASKAPAGFLFLFATFCLLFFEYARMVWEGKSMSSPIIYLFVFFASLAGFVITYFSLLGPSNVASDMHFQPGWLIWKTWFYSTGLPYSKIFTLLIPFHLAGFIPFGFLGSILYVISKGADCFSPSFAVVFGASFVGVLGGYLFQQVGFSNLQFLLLVVPCYNLLACNWFVLNFKRLSGFMRSSLILILIISFSSFLSTMALHSTRAIDKIWSVCLRTPTRIVPHYGYMKKDEFLALQWISENTPTDAVIAGEKIWVSDDRSDISRGAVYFYYSAFSKRQLYLEGWGFSIYRINNAKASDGELKRRLTIIEQIFSNNGRVKELLIQEKINYILVDKDLRPDFYPQGLDCVFENKGVSVFAISGNMKTFPSVFSSSDEAIYSNNAICNSFVYKLNICIFLLCYIMNVFSDFRRHVFALRSVPMLVYKKTFIFNALRSIFTLDMYPIQRWLDMLSGGHVSYEFFINGDKTSQVIRELIAFSKDLEECSSRFHSEF